MNTLQTNTLLILLTLSICIGGCNKNETDQETETPTDTVPLDLSNIKFDTLTIEQVQGIMQGKWKIIRWGVSGEFYSDSCELDGNEYVEFIGSDTIHIMTDSIAYAYEIQDWGEGKERGGYYKYFILNCYYIEPKPGLDIEWYKVPTKYSFWGIFDGKINIGFSDLYFISSQSFTLTREE